MTNQLGISFAIGLTIGASVASAFATVEDNSRPDIALAAV